MMTLNELIKTAVTSQQPQQPPSQPQKQPTQLNQYGYNRASYKLPSQFAFHTTTTPDGRQVNQKFSDAEYKQWQKDVADWEAMRKSDLEAKGIQLTDENKHLWNHQAAWNYINQQQTTAKEDTGRAWYKPWTWLEGAPQEYSQATTNYDPVEMEAAKARAHGYSQGTETDVMLNRAKAAQIAANYADKWLVDENEYNRQFANELAAMGMSPDDIRATVEANRDDIHGRNLGYGVGDALYGTHKFSQFALHNSLQNLAEYAAFRGAAKLLTPTSMAATRLGRIAQELPAAVGIPGIRTYGERYLRDFVNDKAPQFGTTLGMNEIYNREKELRGLYGDDFVNQMLPLNMLRNADGQVMNPFDPRTGSADPANYAEYRAWADELGYGDRLYEPAVQQQWVNEVVGSGTMNTTFLYTPMFQNLSPEARAQAMTDWFGSRVYAEGTSKGLFGAGGGGSLGGAAKMGWQKYVQGKSNAEFLSDAIRNDETGVFTNALQDFLLLSDSDTISKFMGMNAGSGGKGPGGDTSALFDSLHDAYLSRLQSRPDQINKDLQALYNLRNAQGASLTEDQASASQGVATIKKVFAEALADKDIVSQMSFDDKYQLAKTLLAADSIPGGVSSMGPEYAELANTAKETIQSDLRAAMFDSPENARKVFELFALSNGMDGVAKAASSPWVFWSIAAALLAGGVLLNSSGIDEEDDEEDEEEAEYQRALRRNPYA